MEMSAIGRWLAPASLGICLVVAGCSQPSVEEQAGPSNNPTGKAELSRKAQLGEWGIQTHHIAQTTEPGDDFYRYVNDGWLKTAQLPKGMSRFNSFTEVFLRTEQQLQTILEQLQAGTLDKGQTGNQVRDLYLSYMDEATIESRGLAPIQDEINAILQSQNYEQIARWMAKPLHASTVGIGVGLDPKKPEQYVLMLYQSGLGLPERAYYLRDKEPFVKIRAAYLDYMQSVFQRSGIDRPRERAEAVLAFETELAKVQWTPEQQRDRLKNFHPMTREQLLEFAPGFDWPAFLNEYQVDGEDRFVVNTDSAIQASALLLAKTPIDVLRSYLAFHFIDNCAPFLPKAFADARFAFYGGQLEGIDEQRDRPYRGLNLVNSLLGELLGELYVEQYFPASSKTEMESYIPYIREAFRSRIAASTWMDEATRREAYAKLDGFTAKIAYPDKWKDYSNLNIQSDDLLGNYRRAVEWHMADERAKLHEPRRDWEWGMSPQTVNAYYSSTSNEIVFPAAILQPPFFDPNADPAVNFAAIGGVIGHEMGHGFDDQGSRSDGKGVLRDWWTESTRADFESRTSKLVAQYDAYEPLPGTHVSGQLTLGENIGDLGGLSIAHTAYLEFVDKEYDGRAPVLDGFTGEQRFFMGWAQIWRQLSTEDTLRKQLLSDPHSPGEYRVNGVVRNMDDWYRAFNVESDDELYLPPADRVHIW